MTANPSALTQTEKNLWNAIVSEALANLKYNAYAQRAMQEGHPEVAQIFQEVAGPRPSTASTTCASPAIWPPPPRTFGPSSRARPRRPPPSTPA